MSKNKPVYSYKFRNIVVSGSDELVYKCELDPETKTTLHVHLYKDVKNVEQIRKNILKGLWKCVIIKPALIQDPLQIAAAANRAVLSEKNNTMTTKSVFTEILYNLSLTKNISQSLSKFGIDKGTEMFVCFLITPGDDNSKKILDKIEGEACKMNAILTMKDGNKIKSAYKIHGLKCDIGTQGMLDLIISRMAAKNIISFGK